MVGFSRKDGILSAVAVAVLLIGTATGNAIALLVMSMVALSLMAVFYRKQLSGRHFVAATAAMVTAAAVGILMSTR